MDTNGDSSSWICPPRQSSQRVRRDSCQSLFTSTLPTIHEVEPLVTPTRPCGHEGSKTDTCKTNTVILIDHDEGPGGQPSQLSRIISAAAAHGGFVSPGLSADQHVVPWGFTAFSVEKCGVHYSSQQVNKLTVCVQDIAKTDQHWTSTYITDKSGTITDDHLLSTGSLYRMSSHNMDKTDSSCKLLGDVNREGGNNKTCSQRLQMRIMILLGVLFVSGIIIWILSPFLHL
ncbi:hypothetical protein Btru_005375 [Bulinus truncatus]|nr:hypothetical protein Btru_005375 [Bulinus truncatus]